MDQVGQHGRDGGRHGQPDLEAAIGDVMPRPSRPWPDDGRAGACARPDPGPAIDHRRIGLDTGAYATGVLSAMRFQDTDRTTLQTRVIDGRVMLRRD